MYGCSWGGDSWSDIHLVFRRGFFGNLYSLLLLLLTVVDGLALSFSSLNQFITMLLKVFMGKAGLPFR